MDNTIEITEIHVKDNRILYSLVEHSSNSLLKDNSVQAWIQFDHTEGLNFNLNQIPTSVLLIPMTLYLLPITYFYNVELVVPTIDKMLFEQLPSIYDAYSKIFGPFNKSWCGKLVCKQIGESKITGESKYNRIVFFSGGLDALSAGINNAGKKTILVSIPSIEHNSKNEGQLRNEKYSLIREFSELSESPWVLISNNFNLEVFNDILIQTYLKRMLNSVAFNFNGWFGIKYIANMCSVAPFAFAMGITELVMGSTFEQLEDKKSVNLDGANPELSDSIKFAGIKFTEQDELNTRRQEKCRKVIDWCNEHDKKVRIWTCFSDRSEQCGICNKCVRTQLNILTIGENPKEWGFSLYDEKQFMKFIKSYSYWEGNPCWLWDNVDAIDDKKTYPYNDELLHWLKRIGYKKYLKRATIRRKVKLMIRIKKYPHYLHVIIKKILEKIHIY